MVMARLYDFYSRVVRNERVHDFLQQVNKSRTTASQP